MKTYLAFYCGRKTINKPIDLLYRFIDFLIRIFTGGKFSHVEIAVLTDSGFMCYSSSGRDGGVRKKLIDVNNDNWVLLEIDETQDLEHYLYLTDKAKYDYIGVLGALLPFIRCSKRYFCSEWVYNAINYQTMIKTGKEVGYRFSPNDLYALYLK